MLSEYNELLSSCGSMGEAKHFLAKHLLSSCGSMGEAKHFFSLAKEFQANGNLRMAATAYDRAYGLNPENHDIAIARKQILAQLAVVEHGMKFCYIPAGAFLMGSETGEADEQPIHPVELGDFWLSEMPVSWATYCELMKWELPPHACPAEKEPENHSASFGYLHEENKIRLQYCENTTERAMDWHAHCPQQEWVDYPSGKNPVTTQELFGLPERENQELPWGYGETPMVSISWQSAEELCHKISTGKISYRLPTEAEWEKSARGGLINCTYPWGNEPPNENRCDFNRFDQFSILPTRRFPPNGYDLYGMSGSVWEWTSDWYDALYYNESSCKNPKGPEEKKGPEKVLRGGSWADCADVLSVSFRMSRQATNWREECWGRHFTPNIGFRLCRVEC